MITVIIPDQTRAETSAPPFATGRVFSSNKRIVSPARPAAPAQVSQPNGKFASFLSDQQQARKCRILPGFCVYFFALLCYTFSEKENPGHFFPAAVNPRKTGKPGILCGRGGNGRRAGLRILWGNPWGFKSLRPHQVLLSEYLDKIILA